MRYLIIEASGDNDELHKKALSAAVDAVKRVNRAPAKAYGVTKELGKEAA